MQHCKYQRFSLIKDNIWNANDTSKNSQSWLVLLTNDINTQFYKNLPPNDVPDM